ncbi:hypothetical protein H7F15_16585 [Pontibacter sp. Tf4]|uniref:DUF5694 domain-containing protein n=1 Tax=Pontibacter sp. Tf4 TaxID=2761620 RepID=UPI0016254C60|nr:DUF5694 domain-containing protein [Pontibacter sp. Tf4]MBB6612661.1 hypothetical protein [Pontibacter sp. Tf4]
MKKLVLAALLLAGSYITPAEAQKSAQKEKRAQVMLLGTFHFSHRNLDVIKTEKEDQLDVMTPESQQDIQKITGKLAKFTPTKIAIETFPEEQAKVDSLYQAYLDGRYELKADEIDQLAFRLAKQLGHKRVYCINAWGDLDTFVKPGAKNFDVRDYKKERLEKFWTYMQAKTKERGKIDDAIYNQKGTLYQVLLKYNNPENIRRKHENYFRDAFQYEEQEYDYTGVDWYNASWFSRNLRIFRNIQRITESPDDRILVIYGAGHLATIQQAVDSSPTHKLVSAYKLLK